MTTHRATLIASVAAAMMAAAMSVPAHAASKPGAAPTMQGPTASTALSQLKCPDPAPVGIASNAIVLTVTSTLELQGFARNVGSADFVPGTQPEALQLWWQWPGEAPSLLAEAALGTLRVGDTRAVHAATDRRAYIEKLASVGAPPQLIVKVVTSSTKDCRRGNANEYSALGPSAVMAPETKIH